MLKIKITLGSNTIEFESTESVDAITLARELIAQWFDAQSNTSSSQEAIDAIAERLRQQNDTFQKIVNQYTPNTGGQHAT